MRTTIFVVWILILTGLFLVALKSWLESISGKSKTENPGDAFRQFLFVLICVAIARGIDLLILPSLVNPHLPSWIPPDFVLLILLPFVLYLGARIWGPSTKIRIKSMSKAPASSVRRR